MNIEKAVELKNQRIKKAISHRDKQIAYFNSVNAAIQLCSTIKNTINQSDIIKWRDWFFEQWQEWYVSNYDLEDDKEKAF